MSIKEGVRNLFKPKEIRAAERMARLQDAIKLEEKATALFIEGEVSLAEYNEILETTSPITRINLRKLATGLNRR